MKTNPTCHLKRSQIWGFEMAHLGASLGVMMVSNIVLSALKLPVVISWILGLTMILILRVLSIGQKAGHFSFVLRFLVMPRIYLGARLRNRGDGKC